MKVLVIAEATYDIKHVGFNMIKIHSVFHKRVTFDGLIDMVGQEFVVS